MSARVAVIGAGPAGITAAYELARRGASVDAFESGEDVGGLARSIELWGHRVDLGPHRFFTADDRVRRLWLDIAAGDCRAVDRLTRIYYRGRFFHYPLRPANALWNLGPRDAARAIASYLRERWRPAAAGDAADGGSLERWLVRRFGQRLYETFFKPYSEKLWGIPCSEIDRDFAAQRIRAFSLGRALMAMVGIGARSARTLASRFLYPIEGSGMIFERMARAVEARGGRVRLTTAVRRVVCEGSRAIGVELAGGEFARFDHVVSTMPMTELVRGLADVPAAVSRAAAELSYRHTLLVYLLLESRDLFPDQWLYIHSPELRVGRVTNFRNWLPELWRDDGFTILGLEYWSSDGEALWSASEESLIEVAAEELRATGLARGASVRAGRVVRVPASYPVYRRGYRELVGRIAAFLDRIDGLSVAGRGATFKYNNQDHSMLMGMLVAERILDGRPHDLWAVNTEYDRYQERIMKPSRT